MQKKWWNIIFVLFISFMLFSGVVSAADVSNLNFCDANGIKLTMKIIGYAIFIVKIVIPIVLIVYGTIDIVKAVIKIDFKDEVQKWVIQFIKRAIAAVLIFMAPGIINGIFNMLIEGYETSTLSEYKTCFTCLFNPGECEVARYGE